MKFPLKATFVALPLEQEAKRAFQEIQERLRDYERIVSFQNPASPHLTLMYWPEVMEIEYAQLMTQCEKIAAKIVPFVLHTADIQTFGNRGLDRVLYIDIAFSEELARLKKMCPWPNPSTGSGQAVKPFSPHITLARIRHPGRFSVVKKKILKQVENCTFGITCDRLRLYAEIDGAKQTALQDFPLYVQSSSSSGS